MGSNLLFRYGSRGDAYFSLVKTRGSSLDDSVAFLKFDRSMKEWTEVHLHCLEMEDMEKVWTAKAVTKVQSILNVQTQVNWTFVAVRRAGWSPRLDITDLLRRSAFFAIDEAHGSLREEGILQNNLVLLGDQGNNEGRTIYKQTFSKARVGEVTFKL